MPFTHSRQLINANRAQFAVNPRLPATMVIHRDSPRCMAGVEGFAGPVRTPVVAPLPVHVPFSPLRTGYQRWLAFVDSRGPSTGYVPTESQRVARERFAAMTAAEVEQDIRDRTAAIRKDRKESRQITPGAERAMRKMLTEELGMTRIRYATVVTLHRIMSRLDASPAAAISKYDDALGDENTIRSLQHVLADAGYLTQAPKFYGNGKATTQAFKGTGRPRQRTKLIPSESYWDGLEEFLAYDKCSSLTNTPNPAHMDEADIPY